MSNKLYQSNPYENLNDEENEDQNIDSLKKNKKIQEKNNQQKYTFHYKRNKQESTRISIPRSIEAQKRIEKKTEEEKMTKQEEEEKSPDYFGDGLNSFTKTLTEEKESKYKECADQITPGLRDFLSNYIRKKSERHNLSPTSKLCFKIITSLNQYAQDQRNFDAFLDELKLDLDALNHHLSIRHNIDYNYLISLNPMNNGAQARVSRLFCQKTYRFYAFRVSDISNFNAFLQELLVMLEIIESKNDDLIEIFKITIEDNKMKTMLEYGVGDLHQYFKYLSKGKFKIEKEFAIFIISQAFNQAKLLRSYRIYHRDIKPDNIIITKDGKIKFTDFGLSHLLLENQSEKGYYNVVGSPRYMADVLRKAYDQKIFKLDCNLWECDIESICKLAEDIGLFSFDLKSLESPSDFELIDLKNFEKKQLSYNVRKMIEDKEIEEKLQDCHLLSDLSEFYKYKLQNFILKNKRNSYQYFVTVIKALGEKKTQGDFAFMEKEISANLKELLNYKECQLKFDYDPDEKDPIKSIPGQHGKLIGINILIAYFYIEALTLSKMMKREFLVCEAIDFLEKIVEVYPNSSFAITWLCKLSEVKRKHHFSEGEAHLKRAEEILAANTIPEKTKHYFFRCMAHFYTGINTEKALKSLKECFKIHKEDPHCLWLQGIILREREEPCYKENGHYKRENLLESMQYFEKAEERFLIENSDNTPMRARACQAKASVIHKFAEEYKENYDSEEMFRYFKGQGLSEQIRAYELLKKSCKSFELQLEFLNLIAFTYLHLGSDENLRNYSHLALEIGEKNFPKGHKNMFKTYENVGMYEERQKNYEQALKYYVAANKMSKKIDPKAKEGITFRNWIARICMVLKKDLKISCCVLNDSIGIYNELGEDYAPAEFSNMFQQCGWYHFAQLKVSKNEIYRSMAIEEIQNSLKIRRRIYPENHLKIQKSLALLQDVKTYEINYCKSKVV